jgi:putative MATE family efflux protein
MNPFKQNNPGNDLTQGNLVKNLLYLSLPIMFSNFMQTFYNLTDAFWLGKLGEKASSAVSVAGIAFPLIFFLTSFGSGFMIAGTSLIAQYKGANQLIKLKEVVAQFILIVAFFAVIFIVISFISIDLLLNLLHVPESILSITKEYILITLTGIFVMFIFLLYQSFAHGLGDTISPMKVQIVSVLINVFLDPIFIFGFGFIPKMETFGAAIATLIAQIVAAIMAIYFLKHKASGLLPEWKDLVPQSGMIKRIISISIPASLSQSITSFGFLLLQGFVNSFGVVVISTFSIGNRMTSFFMMPAMGISSGLATIVGQNVGAGNEKRAEESVNAAFALVMTIMTIGCLALFFFGAELTRFFINDPAVIEVGRRMFKVTSLASLVFGILFVLMGAFNGSGHTKPMMILNISRLWLFRIPLVFLLSGRLLDIAFLQGDFTQKLLHFMANPLSEYPYDALWWSMVISNIFSSIWAYAIFKKGKWKQAKIETHDLAVSMKQN